MSESEQPSSVAGSGGGGSAATPQRVGQYEVLRKLASGPMGDVLMAKAPDESRHAIKLPKTPQVKVSEHAHKMLKAQLDPRLRPYLEIDFDAARNRYMAMDYLEVRPASLSSLDGLDQAQTIEFMLSALAALKQLHKADIVHGNLKTSNILVRRTKDTTIPGTVAGAMPILGDIGLRYQYDPDYFVGATAEQVFSYMAPEVIEAFVAAGLEDDWKVAPSADIYAFGVSLVEIYSGFRLFDMPGEDATPARFLEEKRRRRYVIAERNDHKSKVRIQKLNDVVARCLDPDPNNRFTGVDELEAALQKTLVVDGRE